MPVTTFTSSTKIRHGFDRLLCEVQLEALQRFKNAHGMPYFCECFLMILAKREFQGKRLTSRLIPFRHHKIQLDLENKAKKRNLVLKPRQIGSTTWHILCRLFIPAILEPGSSGLLISQTKAYGAQHFRILQRALKNFGRSPVWLSELFPHDDLLIDIHQNLLHTQYSARHEILFDFLDSKVIVDSAENENAGTGLTIQHLVGTEVAYWPGDPETLLAQAKETVPATGTVDLESTPNGMGGYFFEEWQRAKDPGGEFTSHFYPWWWQEEYQETKPADSDTMTDEEEKMVKEFAWTMKQLAWRRGKQVSLRGRFVEKYPEDSTTCFLTSGDLFMDKEILREIKIRVMGEKPLSSYHDGQLLIYKRRIKGRRYVIGADAAEGNLVSTDNADFNAAVVLDVDSGEEMACYKSRVPPEEFAVDLVDLGEMYNMALVAVERNGPGGTVNITLQRQCLYGNVYLHREWWKEGKKVILQPGWPTNVRFRPIALNKLAAMVRDAPDLWHSERFIDEALTFIMAPTKKKELGGGRKPQGAQGCHDDTVLCRSVAAIVRLVLLGYFDTIESPSERYGETGEETDEEVA
jgi:hypothetical protein